MSHDSDAAGMTLSDVLSESSYTLILFCLLDWLDFSLSLNSPNAFSITVKLSNTLIEQSGT